MYESAISSDIHLNIKIVHYSKFRINGYICYFTNEFIKSTIRHLTATSAFAFLFIPNSTRKMQNFLTKLRPSFKKNFLNPHVHSRNPHRKKNAPPPFHLQHHNATHFPLICMYTPYPSTLFSRIRKNEETSRQQPPGESSSS